MLTELGDAAPLFLHGAWVTLLYTVLGALAALLVSFVFGLMALSGSMLVRGVSRTIVEFFRGTSLVIQLLWIFFVLPQLGLRFEPMAAATIAFGLNFGAYGSEIVRGAIASVPTPQWEATVALGLGRVQRMRRVILPQALPEMIPPFGNLWIQILKSSSLLYLIGITELTFEVKQLQFEIGSMAAFSIALVVYFLLAQALVAATRWVEVRTAARVGRGPKAVVVSAPGAVGTA
ncbi:ectoine/hydroxyectoine ABC transporter permease subunit EhuC [Mycolicibacterium duvalii]|uniref:Ectoine/hydroxyectoine ABC transporter permease subunit EhuC n=1 Tax=Mycolicibacterium duvalii TaxID=39688 RepID=A0A7I7JZP4_9MYCO|nr:ectoine/hydroxyectoine ABC transporter permease subunit EhuC [Mycolicibacterium duvalii]MCV7369758.1 ectoine/hydroxyectoine ABC transporter permease subunit EhuC [Mycolicibacterium duvalii]PEG43467.1 ectoine/hydroxyectoine ABC transporter permease subunit EhuC [Mycolicibacterium duvalii]BBX17243.1 ectoine/hydroxyectoine ABC transporter permease subunit EhuC [Mycolicibacterium duvalii]